MKKFLPIILILTTLLGFFAPVGFGLNKNSFPSIQKQLIKAEEAPEYDDSIDGYRNAFIDSKIFQKSSIYVPDPGGDYANVEITAIIDTGLNKNDEGTISTNFWKHTATQKSFATLTLIWPIGQEEFKNENLFVIKIVENNTNKIGLFDITKRAILDTDLRLKRVDPTMVATIKTDSFFSANSITPVGNNGLSSFNPDTNYTVSLYYKAFIGPVYFENNILPFYSKAYENGEIIPGLESEGKNYYKIAESSFKTASKTNNVSQTNGVADTIDQIGNTTSGAGVSSNVLPACGLGTVWTGGPDSSITGCFVRFFYYVFFVPTSYLFGLAGTLFDFAFAYSVNDSSYRTEFITQGWGIMRDFCNMFFIFVMLYIALSTILGFKKSKTQEMIINVIIVGLFINFSLFFTKVIIDSSNILARVFYTSDVITVTEKSGPDASKLITKIGNYDDADIIPMSAAIVSKVDPQSLVIHANKINVPDKGGKADAGDMTGTENSPGVGTWLIVIFLATAINIVGFTVFLSVALIFIVRIVGLWLAMIFSPLAFFSYTVPALGSIPKFGYKQWWPETLKLAFLAPVFIFFMYLILAFLTKGLNIMDAREEATNLMFVIAIVLPFAVIMVLMMEAKKIAVKFSGEMGAQVSKMGSSLGGMVLGATVGAATGGAALALRSTIGRAAVNKTQDSDLQDKAKKGGMTGMWARAKLGTYDKIGKSTFDARNTGLAKKAESALDTKFSGNNILTKVAEGGRAGALDRRIESREKSSEIYNKAIQRQDALDKINGKSKDLSEVEAYEADAKAKEWNRKYLKDMVEAKKKWENNPDNKNDPFDENKYKLKYLHDSDEPEPLSASEQNKQKIKDEADTLEYGDDYVERRNKAKEEARTDGEEGNQFNEREFRQNNNIQPVSNLGETKTKQLRELRSKIKPEKEPLNELEKYDIEKQRSSAKKKLELANNEIAELKKIAQKAGTIYDDPDKEKIDEAVKKKQGEVIELDNDINIETTKIQELAKELSRFGNLNNVDQKMISAETKSKISLLDQSKQALLGLQKNKKLKETEIRGFESLIKEKERYDNTVEKQKEIINEAEEKLKIK